MKYIEIEINTQNIDEQTTDIVIAVLSHNNFEAFNETDNSLFAYIPENLFNSEHIASILSVYNLDFQKKYIEEKNWNAEWEKNFKPTFINDDIVIKSPHHTNIKPHKYEIIIEPKMSFGTGHHETTFLMCQSIYNMDFTNKRVLDMGCGTGILAILASKSGASEVTAIDNDKWAYTNTLENVNINNCDNIRVILGGIDSIPENNYDIILANINTNILREHIPQYKKAIGANAHIVLSGFMENDFEKINNCCHENGLLFVSNIKKNNWIAATYKIS